MNVENNIILRTVDRIANWCTTVGVYMLIFVTLALSYEAIARYAFHAPTKWTQDISTTLQIWFTYLGMSYVLREGKMIRITALLTVAPRWLNYILEFIALSVVFAFSLVAVYKGWEMFIDSVRLGRKQPTMLALPNWISELPIVLGFALLSLQSLAEIIRLPFRGPPKFSIDGEVTIDNG